MQVRSLDQVNAALKEIKIITNELEVQRLATEKKTMPLQQKINDIQDKSKKKADPLFDTVSDLEERIETFVRKNEATMDGSTVLSNGSVLLRKGKAKVELLGDTKDTLAKLKEFFRKKYIRVTEAINKTAILADEENLTQDQLDECGLRIVRESTFNYKLK